MISRISSAALATVGSAQAPARQPPEWLPLSDGPHWQVAGLLRWMVQQKRVDLWIYGSMVQQKRVR